MDEAEQFIRGVLRTHFGQEVEDAALHVAAGKLRAAVAVPARRRRGKPAQMKGRA